MGFRRGLALLSMIGLTLSTGLAPAGQIVLSDGTVIDDPSLTADPQMAAQRAAQQQAVTRSLNSGQQLNTDHLRLINELCYGKTNGQANYSGSYSSEQQCYDSQMTQMQGARDKILGEAKKGSGNAESGDSGNGGGSPSMPQQQGGQQQAQQPQQQPAQQASQNPATSAAGDQAGGAGGSGDDQIPAGASCEREVKKRFQACEQKRLSAERACDPNQHAGLQEAGATADRSLALAGSGATMNNSSTQTAFAKGSLAPQVKAFAGGCRQEHVSCESSCAGVRKAAEKLCKTAKEKAAVKSQVETAENDHKPYCGQTLAAKSTQAEGESASMASTGDQNAKSADSTGMGALSGLGGLSGLMQNKGAEDQKQKEEYEKLQKAFEKISAQEGLQNACQQSQFQGLKSCVCRGLDAAACAQRMPTSTPVNNTVSPVNGGTPSSWQPGF
ncbi:MAG: hypothetical protein KF865_11195 [Bdellovibrionaceae bacterium]|nr:hypothetical protein [Pseudobdellovibrionaceae bacterium]